jgi:hypothetical protein
MHPKLLGAITKLRLQRASKSSDSVREVLLLFVIIIKYAVHGIH